MKNRFTLFALVMGAGMAAPALAQDSVSTNANGGNGLPGDALNPWSTAQQCASFRVGVTPFTTSKGFEFGIAPLVKSSKTDNQFFSSLVSAHGISPDLLVGVPYANGTYSSWNAPGFGVHPTENMPGQQIAREGLSTQFSVALAEFSGTANVITGAIVNFDPADPLNLFVKRVVGANNSAVMQGSDTAQFGMGVVDANGNVTFRADDFLVNAGPNPLVGNNIFRVDLMARNCQALNQINNLGGSDAAATAWIVQRDINAHNVPNALPESVAGRPVYTGSNFLKEYRYESAPLATTSTQAHLVTPLPDGDHRGAVAVSTRATYAAGAVSTLGILQKDLAGDTRVIGIWGVDANGAIIAGSLKGLEHPAAVSDPVHPYTSMPAEFDHYHSQTAFRGGSSQVDIALDQAGNVLAAATTYEIGGNSDPFNNIAVARFPRNNPAAAPQWSLAAWVDFVPSAWPNGKPICDATGAAIGELTTLFQVTNGSPFGPSMSAPAFDAAGNIYFLAAVQLYVGADDDALPFPGQNPNRPTAGDDTYTTALIRAVYAPSVGSTFGYRLEVLFTNRDVFVSADTGLEYQIQFLTLADADSVASGTFWSSNTVEGAYNNINNAGFATSDPRNLGGLVVSAEIVYDADQDGDFNDPSGTAPFEPGSRDEAYNVLLYVGAIPQAPSCPADLTGDGQVNSADLASLLGAWGPGAGPADLTGDGQVNSADLASLLGAWGPCPE